MLSGGQDEVQNDDQAMQEQIQTLTRQLHIALSRVKQLTRDRAVTPAQGRAASSLHDQEVCSTSSVSRGRSSIRSDSRHSRRSDVSWTSCSDRVSTSRTRSCSSSSSAVQYMRRRHSFDIRIMPRDPPTFLGRSSKDPERWVGQVSNFFRLVGGSEAKRVAYASTLLTGVAQTW